VTAKKVVMSAVAANMEAAEGAGLAASTRLADKAEVREVVLRRGG